MTFPLGPMERRAVWIQPPTYIPLCKCILMLMKNYALYAALAAVSTLTTRFALNTPAVRFSVLTV